MRVDHDGYGSTTLDIGSHPDFQTRHEVEQYALDEFVKRFKLPLPDLIKLDTQGGERAILSRSQTSLEHASVVFTEAWFLRGYGPETPLITEIIDILDRQNYQLVELGHRFYHEDHRLYSCDAYFFTKSLLDRIATKLPKESW